MCFLFILCELLDAGTRFFVRGVDRDGNAANFVETEQIVTFGKAIAALVQVWLSKTAVG